MNIPRLPCPSTRVSISCPTSSHEASSGRYRIQRSVRVSGASYNIQIYIPINGGEYPSQLKKSSLSHQISIHGGDYSKIEFELPKYPYTVVNIHPNSENRVWAARPQWTPGPARVHGGDQWQRCRQRGVKSSLDPRVLQERRPRGRRLLLANVSIYICINIDTYICRYDAAWHFITRMPTPITCL